MPITPKKTIWWIVITIIVGTAITLCFVVDQNEGGVIENPNTNKEVADSNTATIDPQSERRDSERIFAIRTIQSALASFFVDSENHYPMTLQELLDNGYLNWLPINPQPGGKNYYYSPIGSSPYKSYSLCYFLEVGASGIGAGAHCATPAGVAVY